MKRVREVRSVRETSGVRSIRIAKGVTMVWAFLLFVLLFLWGTGVMAQETSGALTGRVVNSKGEPLVGASLVAVHTPSGTRYALSTDGDGRYTLNNLRIGGPYQVVVTMVGMEAAERNDIQVRLGAAQQLDLVLSGVAQALEGVAVTSRVARQRADDYGAGKNISGEQVRSMPTVNRSITDVTRLTPQGSRDNSFGGTNFRYNNVTIDGAINNDAIGFSPSLGGQTGTSGMAGSSTRTNPISIDAIQDMQVYLAPYDVKIGNFTGGIGQCSNP